MDYNKTKLKTSLKTIFGCKNYLNDLQEQAVENILQRKRDIFVSGYGKSLCYQLPAMVKDNSFIIVITSRISYIKKYTNYFTSKQVTTNYLITSTTRRKKNLIENDIISKKSKMKILFTTPLQYETAYFKNILKKIDKQKLLGIVIDQADKIFSKQENLRNQYQNLDLKVIRVPIITITSATSAKIQEDIIKNFYLLNLKVYAMPILRANLHCDVAFTNIITEPMKHMTDFIEICLDMKSDTHSKRKENLGLIVCEDLETTTSIAKYLEFKKILVLPSDTCLSQDKRSKHTNLEKFKDVKVIVVCEKDHTLSVTNSLVQVMAPKPVKYVSWCIASLSIGFFIEYLKNFIIETDSSSIVYCSVDKLIDNWMKSSCQNDINNELFTVILGSLKNMQCRHEAYAKFFGDKFTACKNRCDVCNSQENTKKRINKLMRVIDNLNLREKLQQILKLPKDSICDKNLQYKCSQPKISNHKTESNVRAQKENREGHHSSANKNLTHRIIKSKESSSTKSCSPDNKQHKSSSKKKIIEVITISDDEVTNSNEVNISNKKRHRTTVQTQGIFEQTKRRKLS